MPAKKTADPEDKVIRATEMEVLRFESMEGKISRAQQQIRIIDFQIADEQRKFGNIIRQLNGQKETLRRDVEDVLPKYRGFMTELAEKYGLDPQHMVIDTETGILKEEVPGPPEGAEEKSVSKKPVKKAAKKTKKATKKKAAKKTKK